jgi:hypothetical protein
MHIGDVENKSNTRINVDPKNVERGMGYNDAPSIEEKKSTEEGGMCTFLIQEP